MKTWVAAAVALALAGCGHSDEKGAAAPSPVVLELAISPATDFLKLKGSERFVATARLSTGATEAVSATWSSDGPAVTVDGSGLATATGIGTATITASYEGRAATRRIRVLPDYAGRWTGSFFVTSCTVEGNFRQEWCRPVLDHSFASRLDLVQTRDVLSGSWTLQDESTGTVQGTIAENGTLSLTGTLYQGTVAVSIASWESLTTDNVSMTGRFSLTWTAPGGLARTQAELRDFRHE